MGNHPKPPVQGARQTGKDQTGHSRASFDSKLRRKCVQPLTMTSQRAGIPATPREDDLEATIYLDDDRCAPSPAPAPAPATPARARLG